MKYVEFWKKLPCLWKRSAPLQAYPLTTDQSYCGATFFSAGVNRILDSIHSDGRVIVSHFALSFFGGV